MSNKNLVDREIKNITELNDETFENIKDILLTHPVGGEVDDYNVDNRKDAFTYLNNRKLIQLSVNNKTFRVSKVGFEVAFLLVKAYENLV